ncbi:MAG TPA: branched-chain amino acid ABC transporter substrate-binding protein, partial [Candidatus Dormibacteraeota bacterium]|nr:branched-chain amino acid ABC transporter substrate-binding protein [Candidatus Dormibacteraeota bacterium]
MRLPKLLAGLAVASVALAACGTTGGGTGQTIKGTIKIGIDLPVSGSDASDGQPTQNGAKLAIKKAAKVCGASSHTDACFTLQSFPLDDAVNGVHDVGQGAKNVQQFVADSTVLGMVGPFNSSVAAGEIPIANSANLAMISPANTNECLTQEPADGHCKGQAAKLRQATGKNNYFRVCTTDLIQGPAGADYAYNKLGKKKVYVMNDQQQYGLGIAKNFAAQFTKDGGTVLNPNDLGAFDPSSTNDFKSQLNRANSLGADVVFFGGTTATKGGQIRKQMQGILSVPYVAGDGISGNQFAKDAGANAADSYFTVAGPYPLKLATAQTFNAAYKSEYGNDPGAYSAQAYDAAGIVIAGISKAIDDAGGSMPSRDQVRAAIAKTQGYKG